MLNGLLIEHFLAPLQHIASTWPSIFVVDCLNSHDATYPAFFSHVDRDPAVFYIFVHRGNFMNIPDKDKGDQRFATTCVGPQSVHDDNVMVVSVCSSYMYTLKLDRPRCSFKCKISEGLFNAWSVTKGAGSENRFRTPFLSLLSAEAEDQCQLDDFVMGVCVAFTVRLGALVRMFSLDKRFRAQAIELPRILYPFYLVVQTSGSRVGVPVYQQDSAFLYRELNNSPNPDYITNVYRRGRASLETRSRHENEDERSR